MKVKINGWVIARQYEWEDKPVFTFYPFKPAENATDCVIVSEHEFEVEIPDNFDMRPAGINSLNAQKQILRNKFYDETTAIDEKIAKLLAITNEVNE